ncbi:MAG: mRNA-capping enzyme subunit beta [Thelocarpon superellum]|nr:MAG: mRNA-capping enzyme subunit beta [Thelocarpon superellum]
MDLRAIINADATTPTHSSTPQPASRSVPMYHDYHGSAHVSPQDAHAGRQATPAQSPRAPTAQHDHRSPASSKFHSALAGSPYGPSSSPSTTWGPPYPFPPQPAVETRRPSVPEPSPREYAAQRRPRSHGEMAGYDRFGSDPSQSPQREGSHVADASRYPLETLPANSAPPVPERGRGEWAGPSPVSYQTSPSSAKVAVAPEPASPSPARPSRKRGRDEPPIFAQSVKRVKSDGALPIHKGVPAQSKNDTRDIQMASGRSSRPGPAHGETNGAGVVPQAEVMAAPSSAVTTAAAAAAAAAEVGPLGPWEASFTDVIPSQEITRAVMDFLFVEVVQRSDVGSTGQIEVEAKLGQLIDPDTDERIDNGSSTECVLNKNSKAYGVSRAKFRSSMTEAQHRMLNQYLNRAVATSRAPPATATGKPRIPMDYVHTRERDRFYVLPSAMAMLPLSVRPLVKRELKVRATTDQKTGQILAKIIKVRLADLHVHSPRTAFDWRISVNLEMPYEGEMEGLVEVSENGKRPERNKDRMSYRHLAYQIDLTQVTMHSDGASRVEKEHELEVEVSAERIREQGLLAQAGQSAQYEDIIQGFVNNVRILTRAV